LVLTLSQILDRTTPDFNLLIAACSQDQINVIIGFFLFECGVVGLSAVIHYGASKSYALTRNITTYHRVFFVIDFYCDYVSEQNFEPNCIYGRFLFPSNVESF
jgi:hypothetical protein